MKIIYNYIIYYILWGWRFIYHKLLITRGNVYPGLINPPPPYRSTRSTRSSEEVQKPNPPNNVTIHSSINDYYKIPMGKDWKTYGKQSNSYGNIRKLMINHQIPMRKGKKTYGKPSDPYGFLIGIWWFIIGFLIFSHRNLMVYHRFSHLFS